ncbi:unnamed protein product, partial [Medioppia subpectinata]
MCWIFGYVLCCGCLGGKTSSDGKNTTNVYKVDNESNNKSIPDKPLIETTNPTTESTDDTIPATVKTPINITHNDNITVESMDKPLIATTDGNAMRESTGDSIPATIKTPINTTNNGNTAVEPMANKVNTTSRVMIDHILEDILQHLSVKELFRLERTSAQFACCVGTALRDKRVLSVGQKNLEECDITDAIEEKFINPYTTYDDHKDQYKYDLIASHRTFTSILTNCSLIKSVCLRRVIVDYQTIAQLIHLCPQLSRLTLILIEMIPSDSITSDEWTQLLGPRLTSLSLIKCKVNYIDKIVSNLRQFSSLEEFRIEWCEGIEVLATIPANLKRLRIQMFKMVFDDENGINSFITRCSSSLKALAIECNSFADHHWDQLFISICDHMTLKDFAFDTYCLNGQIVSDNLFKLRACERLRIDCNIDINSMIAMPSVKHLTLSNVTCRPSEWTRMATVFPNLRRFSLLETIEIQCDFDTIRIDETDHYIIDCEICFYHCLQRVSQLPQLIRLDLINTRNENSKMCWICGYVLCCGCLGGKTPSDGKNSTNVYKVGNKSNNKSIPDGNVMRESTGDIIPATIKTPINTTDNGNTAIESVDNKVNTISRVMVDHILEDILQHLSVKELHRLERTSAQFACCVGTALRDKRMLSVGREGLEEYNITEAIARKELIRRKNYDGLSVDYKYDLIASHHALTSMLTKCPLIQCLILRRVFIDYETIDLVIGGKTPSDGNNTTNVYKVGNKSNNKSIQNQSLNATTDGNTKRESTRESIPLTITVDSVDNKVDTNSRVMIDHILEEILQHLSVKELYRLERTSAQFACCVGTALRDKRMLSVGREGLEECNITEAIARKDLIRRKNYDGLSVDYKYDLMASHHVLTSILTNDHKSRPHIGFEHSLHPFIDCSLPLDHWSATGLSQHKHNASHKTDMSFNRDNSFEANVRNYHQNSVTTDGSDDSQLNGAVEDTAVVDNNTNEDNSAAIDGDNSIKATRGNISYEEVSDDYLDTDPDDDPEDDESESTISLDDSCRPKASAVGLMGRLGSQDNGAVDRFGSEPLPDTVTVLDGPNGAKLYLVGTAHFSEKSQQDVSQTILRTQPNIIVLELCESRLSILSMDEKTILEESSTMGVAKIRHN